MKDIDGYVTKDELYRLISHIKMNPDIVVDDKMCHTIVNAISDMPQTDAQPVKHGRWIDYTFYDPYEKSYEQNFEYKCSCCGHMIYNKPNEDDQYCGRCGARMGGDEE